MFWTDWVQRTSVSTSKIERANMDGSDREVWVSTEIQWPNGLSIDYSANRLYWCDAYVDRIESVDIKNKSARVRIGFFAEELYVGTCNALKRQFFPM